MTCPSYMCKISDLIGVKNSKKSQKLITTSISTRLKQRRSPRKLITPPIRTRLKQRRYARSSSKFKSKPKPYYAYILSKYKRGPKTHYGYITPNFLRFDRSRLAGSILFPPARRQVRLEVSERLVVEYYSRR